MKHTSFSIDTITFNLSAKEAVIGEIKMRISGYFVYSSERASDINYLLHFGPICMRFITQRVF